MRSTGLTTGFPLRWFDMGFPDCFTCFPANAEGPILSGYVDEHSRAKARNAGQCVSESLTGKRMNKRRNGGNSVWRARSDVCLPPHDLPILARMRVCWKTFLVIFLSLWLPMQGYGAVAMPFCDHGMAGSGTGHDAPQSGEHHDRHSGHGQTAHASALSHAAGSAHASPGHDSASGANGLSCNNCGACHLACAPAISGVAVMSPIIGNFVLKSAPADSPYLYFPEQLQRPPRSALS